jgi:peptidoglycan/xylan/chitin deacetylase (PgdA/CDA1 family)
MVDALPPVEGDREASSRVNLMSLLYHDVVEPGSDDESGFPGGAAGRYKLASGAFEEHLQALARSPGRPPLIVSELSEQSPPRAWALTFDDGGASALRIGEMLAHRGWKAHFLVTTGRIDTPGFVDEAGVRALRDLGQIVGSHTRTHPDRMSACSWADLVREWQESVDTLAEILGERVRVASVPGGYYSPKVARAAALAGIEALFTSEPTASIRRVDGCLIFGRYVIKQNVSAATASALASGARGPRYRQFAAWNTIKAAKIAGGTAYPKIRRRWLDSRARP